MPYTHAMTDPGGHMPYTHAMTDPGGHMPFTHTMTDPGGHMPYTHAMTDPGGHMPYTHAMTARLGWASRGICGTGEGAGTTGGAFVQRCSLKVECSRSVSQCVHQPASRTAGRVLRASQTHLCTPPVCPQDTAACRYVSSPSHP